MGQEDGTGTVCDGGEGDGRVGVGAGGPPKWEADIPVTPGAADMLWFQHTPGHAGEWLSSAGFGGSPQSHAVPLQLFLGLDVWSL